MKIFLIIASLLILIIPLNAQKKYLVNVQVFSSDNKLKNNTFEISKELLTNIKDLKIVEKNADFSILIMIENQSDNSYVLNYLFNKRAKCIYEQTLVNKKPLQEDCNSLLSFESLSFIETNNLKPKIKNIVSIFNTSVLEYERRQEVFEYLLKD